VASLLRLVGIALLQTERAEEENNEQRVSKMNDARLMKISKRRRKVRRNGIGRWKKCSRPYVNVDIPLPMHVSRYGKIL